MNDNYKFQTADELYNRVIPALTSKVDELKRNNISYITEKDIWNFLSESVWRKKKDLEFYEMVDSILNLDIQQMDKYLINKMDNQQNQDDSIL